MKIIAIVTASKGMKPRKIIIITAACLVTALITILIFKITKVDLNEPLPVEISGGSQEIIGELSPEEKLIGFWLQTQESLDYANEHIHSKSVTVTNKEILEFTDDRICALTGSLRGDMIFSYEVRSGYLILTAEGWVPQRFIIEEDFLVDPQTGIREYEKQ